MAETQVVAALEKNKYYVHADLFYVNRHSFWLAGQDSWTLPPAQNQDMFTQLSNVEPVLQGILQRRRGYTLFTNAFGGNVFTHSYAFRSEALNLKELVFTSPGNVVATDETGATILNPVFAPTSTQAPRMVLSRDYAYFADQIQADSLKWDGTSNALNVTNWGIDINSALSSLGPDAPGAAFTPGGGGGPGSQGPLVIGTGTDQGGGSSTWLNPGSFGTAISSSFIPGGGNSNILRATMAGASTPFNIPGTATITGITVAFEKNADLTGTNTITDVSVVLVKAGAVTGTNHAAGGFWQIFPVTATYGSSADLWGTTWTPSDINNAGFGFQIQAHNSFVSSHNGAVGGARITVSYTTPVSGAWINPNNILLDDGAVATATLSSVATPINHLQASAFGFSVPAGATVSGIQVDITCSQSSITTIKPNLYVSLLKAGITSGTQKIFQPPSTTLATITLGGPGDLWGNTWVSTDFGAAFGVDMYSFFNAVSGNTTFSVDFVQITVFLSASALVLGAPTSGNINLLSGRTYFYVFENSRTGHTSDLSPATLSTGPLTNKEVPLSAIPTSTDPQVDTVIILATADGNDETTLYFVTSLAIGTSTYTDNTPDSLTATVTSGPSLLTNNIYQETDEFGFLHGVANNKLPPLGTFPTKHKGRLYEAKGHILYFSKSLGDVVTSTGLTTGKWEEAWPATNQIDISTRAETISGLLSDGETLWIGTERAIRRLIGDSPQNFQEPEIQFNETGVLNQECWQVVFFEGQSVGSMWLTPDFRVMASDFNTYEDVGMPIQDVLNSINPSAAQTIHAAFVSQGPSDYYMLYLPTGSATAPNTICVFNLRAKKWCIWNPTDDITSSLFNISGQGIPQWLFTSSDGNIYFWDNSINLDRNGNTPVGYAVTIQTVWLDMDDYNIRKFVNQIIPTTADQASLTVAVNGASNELDFNTPLQVIPATTVTPASIPTDVFVPLASGPSHNRAFQFTFVSPPSTIKNVLTGFAIEAGQFHKY